MHTKLNQISSQACDSLCTHSQFHAYTHTRSYCIYTHTLSFTQPPLTELAYPAQLGHSGHIERSLGILVRVVLSEEVVDLIIIGLVLVHNGGLDELWVCQGHG